MDWLLLDESLLDEDWLLLESLDDDERELLELLLELDWLDDELTELDDELD